MNFSDPYIQLPSAVHTHTAILLHGRGSSGAEFAEDFLSSSLSQGQTVQSYLQSWRWVFPTSRFRWSTTFQEDECSWFDIVSLTDVEARHDLQVEGLRESVFHVLRILEHEVQLLDNQASRICLGGISQGMATALWVMLYAAGQIHGPLGGFVGFCGWIPFARQIGALVKTNGSTETKQHRVIEFVQSIIVQSSDKQEDMNLCKSAISSTPVFLAHGVDDPFVSIDLGLQAARVLNQILDYVEWSEFAGADNDGHWIKEPEGFDRLMEFLKQNMPRPAK